MFQIHLSPGAEHLAGIHPLHILQRGFTPAGSLQVFVETCEELLHVVWDLTPQPAAHVRADDEGQIETIGLRQRGEAGFGCRLIPGFQIERGEDVR